MGIEPIIVHTAHQSAGTYSNFLAVQVSDAGAVTVHPYSPQNGALNATYAVGQVDPGMLNNGVADPLITFQTSAGAVITVHDDGSYTSGGQNPIVLSTTSTVAAPAVYQNHTEPMPTFFDEPKRLPADMMDTGRDPGTSGTTPAEWHELVRKHGSGDTLPDNNEGGN